MINYWSVVFKVKYSPAFLRKGHIIPIFHLFMKVPCLRDAFIMAVIVGSTAGSMGFRSDLGTESSSHNLVASLLMINLTSSSVTTLNEFHFGVLDGVGLYSDLLSKPCLIFSIFPMKKSANSFANVPLLSCLGSGA